MSLMYPSRSKTMFSGLRLLMMELTRDILSSWSAGTPMPGKSGPHRTGTYITLTVHFFTQPHLPADQPKKLTSWAILQDEVKFLLILESGVQCHNEGMVHLLQNIPFNVRMLLLHSFHFTLFLNHFHCVYFRVLDFANESNLGIVPHSEDRQ